MGVSKEEKRAKKEAKRLEKLKAQIEARKKVKRIELQRELAAQNLKKKELDAAWREMMIKIKKPEFKKDVEVMWHVFERAFDKKDHVINHTLQLLDFADDQFQRTVASFCVTIDSMIVKFLEDLDNLSRENNTRTAALLKMSEGNAAHIMIEQNVAETHLQLLLYHGYSTADSLAWTTRGENLVKLDEDNTKFANERVSLRSLLENKYNSIWEEYKSILKSYVVDTAENQKHVRKLRQKENLMADIIASQGKKIANSGDMLKKLRTELAAYESGTKQAIFRGRRDRHRAACYKLKKHLTDGCETDMSQIKLLVKSTDKAIQWLKNASRMGEKILRLSALCRKFEGQREKVMPYGSIMPHLPTQTKSSLRSVRSEDTLVTNAIMSTCGLTRLWQRISKAELTKRALCREKMLLQQENSNILSTIQELRENKYGSGSQQCSCRVPIKKGAINPPRSIEGILEISKYRQL